MSVSKKLLSVNTAIMTLTRVSALIDKDNPYLYMMAVTDALNKLYDEAVEAGRVLQIADNIINKSASDDH